MLNRRAVQLTVIVQVTHTLTVRLLATRQMSVVVDIIVRMKVIDTLQIAYFGVTQHQWGHKWLSEAVMPTWLSRTATSRVGKDKSLFWWATLR